MKLFQHGAGESAADADKLKVACTDPDPRVREEFTQQLAASDAYQRMQGWSKKAIADAFEIGVGRIDRLLERTTGQVIADDDPLCDLVPDLRGRGDAWRDAGLTRARKPRPFSRLSVGEKVVLAEESSDAVASSKVVYESGPDQRYRRVVAE